MNITEEEYVLIAQAIGILYKSNCNCAAVVQKLLFEYAKLKGREDTK